MLVSKVFIHTWAECNPRYQKKRGGTRRGVRGATAPLSGNLSPPPVGEQLTIRRGTSSRKRGFLTNKICKK